MSTTGLLANPEKLACELNDQAQGMVEARGKAYLTKLTEVKA